LKFINLFNFARLFISFEVVKINSI